MRGASGKEGFMRGEGGGSGEGCYLGEDMYALDSWSLSHLGYLYPGTAPVMIKLDHNRSCPWV